MPTGVELTTKLWKCARAAVVCTDIALLQLTVGFEKAGGGLLSWPNMLTPAEVLARLGSMGFRFPGLAEDPEAALDLLEQLAGMGSPPSSSSSPGENADVEPILESADLEGLARYIEQRDPRNIICMVGAGLSTAAGIPDFRSPGTGLYDNLQRYRLPRPEAVFELDFFRKSPEAFYDLAKELWPTGQKYAPTRSHFFLTMLARQGRLLRCYTQNIDMLEQVAGLAEDKTIAAHGNFATAHSLGGRAVPVAELEAAVNRGIEACRLLGKKYGSLVKPDIVFFGESLPKRFYTGLKADFPLCDLLIVLGTSLAVGPFNQLIREVPTGCPRALINRDPAGLAKRSGARAGVSQVRGGFCFAPGKHRDVFLQGDCDMMVQLLCTRLGWAEALDKICEDYSLSPRCLNRPARSQHSSDDRIANTVNGASRASGPQRFPKGSRRHCFSPSRRSQASEGLPTFPLGGSVFPKGSRRSSSQELRRQKRRARPQRPPSLRQHAVDGSPPCEAAAERAERSPRRRLSRFWRRQLQRRARRPGGLGRLRSASGSPRGRSRASVDGRRRKQSRRAPGGSRSTSRRRGQKRRRQGGGGGLGSEASAEASCSSEARCEGDHPKEAGSQ